MTAMTTHLSPVPAPGDAPKVPGSRTDVAPDETNTPGATTKPPTPLHDTAPPYQPGDIVVRHAGSRLLVVRAVHDLTQPTVDGTVVRLAPGQQRWLIDCDSPRLLRAPYLPTEIRAAHPADLTHPARRQLVRRLVARHGATNPLTAPTRGRTA